MTPDALIPTTVLMGLCVLAGGAYAGLYSAGRLTARVGLIRAGNACWLIAFGLALAIAALTPLDAGWKLLILVSAVLYAVIPPLTWRYLHRLHVDEHGEGCANDR